jgi:hypothetical protein
MKDKHQMASIRIGKVLPAMDLSESKSLQRSFRNMPFFSYFFNVLRNPYHRGLACSYLHLH